MKQRQFLTLQPFGPNHHASSSFLTQPDVFIVVKKILRTGGGRALWTPEVRRLSLGNKLQPILASRSITLTFISQAINARYRLTLSWELPPCGCNALLRL